MSYASILRRVSVSGSAWESAARAIRERGLRWTPQRRLLIEVLAETNGHVTGSELVERCRARDPETTPSTVYRTLDVLEDIGLVRHAHGPSGREEYHVLPQTEHGHMHCERCGRSWEIDESEAAGLVTRLSKRRGFRVDLTHLSVSGICQDCSSSQGLK
jgi:Fur family ferric uptake transcriptional regulator